MFPKRRTLVLGLEQSLRDEIQGLRILSVFVQRPCVGVHEIGLHRCQLHQACAQLQGPWEVLTGFGQIVGVVVQHGRIIRQPLEAFLVRGEGAHWLSGLMQGVTEHAVHEAFHFRGIQYDREAALQHADYGREIFLIEGGHSGVVGKVGIQRKQVHGLGRVG